MIRLTGERQEIVIVAPEHITCINVTSHGNTGINFADGYAIVTESPEEIARKVLEYKRSVRDGDYEKQLELAGLETSAQKIAKELHEKMQKRLAGLEDTKTGGRKE